MLFDLFIANNFNGTIRLDMHTLSTREYEDVFSCINDRKQKITMTSHIARQWYFAPVKKCLVYSVNLPDCQRENVQCEVKSIPQEN